METLTYSSGRASGCDSPGLLNSACLLATPQVASAFPVWLYVRSHRPQRFGFHVGSLRRL